MATINSFKVQCPSCEAMVPIKDASLVGKKIDCPKCKFRFTVDAPDDAAEPEAEKPSKDDAKSKAKAKMPAKPRDDDDADDGDRPQKKKKAGGSSTMLLVGGGVGVLAIIVLIVGVFVLNGDSSGGGVPSGGGGGGGPRPANVAGANPEAGGGEGGETPAENPAPPAGTTPPVANYGPLKDATNLLLNDSQVVLSINVPNFLRTPAGGSFFDPVVGAARLFRQSMGFPIETVNRVILSGQYTDGWAMGIVQTDKPFVPNDVKSAMQLGTAKTIKGRTYFPIVSNDVLNIIGAYLKGKAAEAEIPMPKNFSEAPLGMFVLDNRTLVIAHQAAMEQFLQQDAQPKFVSEVVPSSAPATTSPMGMPPMGPMGMPPGAPTTPMGIPPGAPMVPMGVVPMGGGATPSTGAAANLFTNNPTYRTIDPLIKAMLNRLEGDKKDLILTLAGKIEVARLGGALERLRTASGGSTKLVPRVPIVGAVIQTFSSSRLTGSVALQATQEAEAKELYDKLNPLMTLMALALSTSLENRVELKGAGNTNSGFPGRPGFPMGPMGPMGPRESNIRSDKIGGAVPAFQFPPPGSPLGPMGPGMMPMGPGFPNPNGVDPNAPKATSTIALTQSDRTVIFDFDLDWQKVYAAKIGPSVRGFIDQQRGQGVMLAGRTHWYNLGDAMSKFQEKGTFPRGTVERRADTSRFGRPFPASARMSWMVDLLPMIGHDAVYRRIDRAKAWDSEQNLLAGESMIPEFLTPTAPPGSWRAEVPSLDGRSLGATNFVGLAGIGMDSVGVAETPETAKRLGIFGYDRQTKVADVQKGDGLSNTIFMIQVPDNAPRPWIRGGGATVQGVPEANSFQPFNSRQPDNKYGAYAIMADGSTRFIAAGISDEVFKSLVTYKGGEKVDSIDKVAPRVDRSELKTPEGPKPSIGGPNTILLKWGELALPEIGGAALFPGQPDRTQTASDIAYIWLPADPRLTILIKPATIPYASAEGEPTEADLDKQLEDFKAKKIFEPKSVEKLTVSGRPARAFEVETARGIFLNRMFLVGRNAVIMEVDSTKVNAQDTKRFFEGMKSIDPKKAAVEFKELTFEKALTKVTLEMPKTVKLRSDPEDAFLTQHEAKLPTGAFISARAVSNSAYPQEDADGSAAAKVVTEYGVKNLKWADPKVSEAKVGDLVGREVRCKIEGKDSRALVFVVNGVAVIVEFFDVAGIKAEDEKKVRDSLKVAKI